MADEHASIHSPLGCLRDAMGITMPGLSNHNHLCKQSFLGFKNNFLVLRSFKLCLLCLLRSAKVLSLAFFVVSWNLSMYLLKRRFPFKTATVFCYHNFSSTGDRVVFHQHLSSDRDSLSEYSCHCLISNREGLGTSP